ALLPALALALASTLVLALTGALALTRSAARTVPTPPFALLLLFLLWSARPGGRDDDDPPVGLLDRGHEAPERRIVRRLDPRRGQREVAAHAQRRPVLLPAQRVAAERRLESDRLGQRQRAEAVGQH